MIHESCIFCKIVNKEIPSELLFEDDEFICIKDIQPCSEIHLLVIPKEHFSSLDSVFPDGDSSKSGLMGRWIKTGVKVAREQGLLPDGFRTVINTHEKGGQTVFHIHMHLLGGQQMTGKMA